MMFGCSDAVFARYADAFASEPGADLLGGKEFGGSSVLHTRNLVADVRYGESGVRPGHLTVVLLREDGDFPIRSYVLHEGARFLLGVASARIAILAYLPEREVDDYLLRAGLAGR